MKTYPLILFAAFAFVGAAAVHGALPTPEPECRNAEFQTFELTAANIPSPAVTK